MPERTLDQRFKEFIDALYGVESIDALAMTSEQQTSSKADYFAEDRQVVIELKSLETDTEHRVEEILKPHRSRPEFPEFFGGWELSKVLKHLPDGEEVKRQATKVVTDSIARLFRKANSQIRSTKATFGLPNSKGLLILLNQKIDVLSPELIIYRLLQTGIAEEISE